MTPEAETIIRIPRGTESLSPLEAAISILVILIATVGAMVPPNPISGDALIGLYASTLGYVFGHKAGANGANGKQV